VRAEVLEIWDLAQGRWVSQAIYAAAALGLADALGDDECPPAAVADAVGADPVAVARLMRALATVGLLAQGDGGGYALTPLGRLLRADDPDSVRHGVLLTLGPAAWRSWGALAECVRTGDTAAKLLDGHDDPFAAFDSPEEQDGFNRAMAEGTRRAAEAVVAAYDFAGVERIVDVGGGYGALLPPVLAVHPGATGVVFDLVRCAAGAAETFARAGLAGRAEFVAGDFFADPVPPGADTYVLKSVIHDWDDDRALAILRNCRAAAGERARLLVVETVLPDRVGTAAAHRLLAASDLTMLVATGGRERTEAEYRALLGAAGFRVTRIVPTAAPMAIVEAVAA
jgi:hypothetical protein